MPNERKNAEETKQKGGTGVKIAVFLLIAAFSAAYFALDIWDGEKEPPSEFSAGFNFTYAPNSSFLHAADDGFFHATRDGVRYLSPDGEILMSYSFTVGSPEFSGRGAYLAVVERNGSSVRVFGKSGELYSAVTEHPILNFSLAANGYMSVVTRSLGTAADAYFLTVYNELGASIAFGNITHERRFPVMSEVSLDGRFHAICFIDISGAEHNFYVNLYHLDRADAANHPDGMFASDWANAGKTPGMMRFMDNNRLIVVADSEIITYNFTGGSLEKNSEPLNNVLSAAAFSGTYFALALGAQDDINKPSEPEGTVLIFDPNLRRLGSIATDGDVRGVTAGDGAILAVSGRTLHAVSSGGSALWQRTVTSDVRYAAFLGQPSRIITAGEQEATVYIIR
jgi:hypothetical protein